MVIKEGIEMKTITNVEMMWSVIVFFFKAAQIPKAIPKGTENITEKKLIEIVTFILEKIITIASPPTGAIDLALPHSHFVNMFESHNQYCSNGDFK